MLLKNKPGLTLVEVLVASFVLSVCAAAVLSLLAGQAGSKTFQRRIIMDIDSGINFLQELAFIERFGRDVSLNDDRLLTVDGPMQKKNMFMLNDYVYIKNETL